MSLTVPLAALGRGARERDAALAYAAGVAIVATGLAVLPADAATDVVAHASTNLVNLQRAPVVVLVASAFVVATPAQLWLLAPLVAVYGELQRRFGRRAVVAAAVFGHVGATLLVAGGLAAGIGLGTLSATVAAAADDVGVSYGLLAAAGLLAGGLTGPRRTPTVVAVTSVLALVLAVDGTSTDVGHLVAWGLGLALAVTTRRRGGSAAPAAVAPSTPS